MKNKQSKNCQRLENFYQSGEISPNLVTLLSTQLDSKNTNSNMYRSYPGEKRDRNERKSSNAA